MRNVNNYPPSYSPFLSVSPLGVTVAFHEANEVHLRTKRGELLDALIKCALETEVSKTEGSSPNPRGCPDAPASYTCAKHYLHNI